MTTTTVHVLICYVYQVRRHEATRTLDRACGGIFCIATHIHSDWRQANVSHWIIPKMHSLHYYALSLCNAFQKINNYTARLMPLIWMMCWVIYLRCRVFNFHWLASYSQQHNIHDRISSLCIFSHFSCRS